MKNPITVTAASLISCISLFTCSSCGDSSVTQVEQDRRGSSSYSTPNNSYSNVSTNAVSTTNAANSLQRESTAGVETLTKPLPGPIEGSYSISRTDHEGSSSTGTLEIGKQGGIYKFSWVRNGKSYTGSGVTIGNTVVVSFTEEKSGNGCGAAIYKIAGNGNLDGKIVYWGTSKVDTERLFLFNIDDSLNGRYTEDPSKDAPYWENDVQISYDEKKNAYHFNWWNYDDRQGWGLRIGNMVAGPFGENHCSYAVYTVESDGTFNGSYSDQLGNNAGTEIAKKK